MSQVMYSTDYTLLSYNNASLHPSVLGRNQQIWYGMEALFLPQQLLLGECVFFNHTKKYYNTHFTVTLTNYVQNRHIFIYITKIMDSILH